MKAWPATSALFFLLSACGGSGGGGGGGGSMNPTPQPPPDQAMGGAWVGTDSNGVQILALSTDSGRLHWVAPVTGEQGFGIASVNGSTISIAYTYVPPLGFPLEADGSASATCSASGTIQERQSMQLTTNCTTALGGMFDASVTLTYDPVYDRDSSLALIAGNYDDGGLVVSVDENGILFEQDDETDCVVNGQVEIIDPDFNAYDVSMEFSSCNTISGLYPELEPLNGAIFTGLGILDDTEDPELAVVGLTGDAGGVTISFIFEFPRI